MIAHKSSSSFSTFLSIHSTLRNLCICSLLVFVHVLLVTTAVAPRDLLEAHPSLSRSIKYLSGLSALTLLCKVFILFDLADNDTRPSTRTLSSSAESAVDDTDKVEVDEVGNVGRYDVFALTWVELGMSMLALTGWICSIPHAMSLFEVFSYKIAMELSLLPTAYSIAFGCISINTAQLIVQLIRLRLSGSASGVWMVRTGYWERRIKLETESETEKAQM